MRDPLNRDMPTHPSLIKGQTDGQIERQRKGSSLPITPACTSLLEAMTGPFTVLDLETTGLDPDRDEIIEMAAILVDAGFNPIGEFTALITPRIALPAQITRLTGIEQSLLDSQGISLQDGMAALLNFLGNRPVFAHYAPFDQSFLSNAAQECNLGFANAMYDTISLAEAAWPDLDSYGLFSLAQWLGVGNQPAHRALADAKATLEVLKEADRVLRSPP